ncbi:hypothetical protein MRB53_004346 [Persea americana]|uniref:Uncharacterized protein n=1 Tax=Persea americana TaxID=3435 RepID=A0ACC2MAY5_PERAE|nr:hypothetical protein MRB53_004346 [Persea americana]
MPSRPVNVPRPRRRANLMPHDPTPSGLKQTPPGLKQIPRDQQIKPESTGGTTIPHPAQPTDTLSSTKNSSFESPKPLEPASPTEKPESASGATIPSPPQPTDTLSTSKSSPFESTESLKPTSICQPVKGRYERSTLSPHDEFPIPLVFLFSSLSPKPLMESSIDQPHCLRDAVVLPTTGLTLPFGGEMYRSVKTIDKGACILIFPPPRLLFFIYLRVAHLLPIDLLGIKMDKKWSISNMKQAAKINNSQKWKRHMTILLLKICGKDF